ncbi:MAG: low affinity iron permease family protein [Alphaproteobacteria bacterium]
MSARNAAPESHLHGNWFERFAHRVAIVAGRAYVFFGALLIVVVWGSTGPIFHFSDTWQLVINTGTTIVTFLMVFLIQQSQNRDTKALQVKLSELIISVKGAHNMLANAEDLSEKELENLEREFRRHAEHAAHALEARKKKAHH